MNYREPYKEEPKKEKFTLRDLLILTSLGFIVFFWVVVFVIGLFVTSYAWGAGLPLPALALGVSITCFGGRALIWWVQMWTGWGA